MPDGVWVRHKGKRVIRSPYGYLLAAECKGTHLWINWTPDPDAAAESLRRWCPFPVKFTRTPMASDKVDRLLAALQPWRVRRGSHWHRATDEMRAELERLAKP